MISSLPLVVGLHRCLVFYTTTQITTTTIPVDTRNASSELHPCDIPHWFIKKALDLLYTRGAILAVHRNILITVFISRFMQYQNPRKVPLIKPVDRPRLRFLPTVAESIITIPMMSTTSTPTDGIISNSIATKYGNKTQMIIYSPIIIMFFSPCFLLLWIIYVNWQLPDKEN